MYNDKHLEDMDTVYNIHQNAIGFDERVITFVT